MIHLLQMLYQLLLEFWRNLTDPECVCPQCIKEEMYDS